MFEIGHMLQTLLLSCEWTRSWVDWEIWGRLSGLISAFVWPLCRVTKWLKFAWRQFFWRWSLGSVNVGYSIWSSPQQRAVILASFATQCVWMCSAPRGSSAIIYNLVLPWTFSRTSQRWWIRLFNLLLAFCVSVSGIRFRSCWVTRWKNLSCSTGTTYTFVAYAQT